MIISSSTNNMTPEYESNNMNEADDMYIERVIWSKDLYQEKHANKSQSNHGWWVAQYEIGTKQWIQSSLKKEVEQRVSTSVK